MSYSASANFHLSSAPRDPEQTQCTTPVGSASPHGGVRRGLAGWLNIVEVEHTARRTLRRRFVCYIENLNMRTGLVSSVQTCGQWVKSTFDQWIGWWCIVEGVAYRGCVVGDIAWPLPDPPHFLSAYLKAHLISLCVNPYQTLTIKFPMDD